MSKSFTSSMDGAPHTTRLDGRSAQIPAAPGRAAASLAANGKAGWRILLNDTIERAVLPRLLAAVASSPETLSAAPAEEEQAIAGFVQLIIDDDIEQLRALADRVILHTGGREALLNDLLKPAAERLGKMWERDACDFMTVTLGVYRLNQIMREIAGAGAEMPHAPGFEHRILLLPAPGEQHSFGISMVADRFREGGWCVRSAPGATRHQLLRLVADEWFDVVGLSVSSERWLKNLPSCIRAVRAASCNPDVFIMVGGYAIIKNSERTRFLSADCAALDAGGALEQANLFMETMVTRRLCQTKKKLSDAGRAL